MSSVLFSTHLSYGCLLISLKNHTSPIWYTWNPWRLQAKHFCLAQALNGRVLGSLIALSRSQMCPTEYQSYWTAPNCGEQFCLITQFFREFTLWCIASIYFCSEIDYSKILRCSLSTSCRWCRCWRCPGCSCSWCCTSGRPTPGTRQSRCSATNLDDRNCL